jgi:hypothetical protein
MADFQDRFATEEAARLGPPSVQTLKEEVRQLFAAAGRGDLSVERFLGLCSRPHRTGCENPAQVPVRGKDGERWEWPYADRIRQSARVFVNCGASDVATLEHGAEEGVGWRGEPVPQYLEIVRETLKMREMGVQAYIKQMPEVRSPAVYREVI